MTHSLLTKPRPETGRQPGGMRADFDFRMPDGRAVDEDGMAAFRPLVAELGLNTEQAQRLIDLYVDRLSTTEEKSKQEFAGAVDQWCAECRSDPELGGPGFDSKLAIAKRALERFGSPGLMQMVDETMIGSHPEFVRLMYRVGRATQDDQHIMASQTETPKTLGEILYPDMIKKGY